MICCNQLSYPTYSIYICYLTYSPDIHRRPVLSVADEKLRGPVPASGHVVSVVLTRADHPGEPEVTELHHPVLGRGGENDDVTMM